jgi:hypothetical protein
MDRWPNSHLIVASPCSGHGAKFATASGEKLARLAVDPTYQVEPFFSYPDTLLSADRAT